MAETNAPPKNSEIMAFRHDIEDYLPEGKILQDFAAAALLKFKVDLEDVRNGVLFTQVFDTTNDEYFEDAEGVARNLQKIRQFMIPHLAIAMVFREYAIAADEDRWWNLAAEFEMRYDDKLKNSLIDIDTDESGAIDEGEEQQRGQTFLRK